MQLAGTLSLALPPRRAIAALHDPENLAAYLPAPSTVRQLSTTAFEFVVMRPLGPIIFKLPGRLLIEPVARGKRYSFVANGKHTLAGGVTLALTIDFGGGGGGATAISYDGTLEATGLAGRLLGERQGRVETVLDAMFAALKARIGRTAEASRTRAGLP